MTVNAGVKIGLVQMRCEKGAITGNLENLSSYLIEADTRGIDIIALPGRYILSWTSRLTALESYKSNCQF